MKKKKTKKLVQIFISSIIFAFGLFLTAGISLADNCPSKTTVEGTNVNFVGELTDMGGADVTYVWFDYGKSTAYSHKTSEKSLTQEGVYCIYVSGLEPCTTYHYRAAARNEAGTSYGEDKTFTTSCGPAVDLKVNGSDGPISVGYGSDITLSWTSDNVDSCSASGDWSGAKGTVGSFQITNLTSSKTFVINCTGPAGSVSDQTLVNVGNSPNVGIKKLVRNLSDGTNYAETISADPSEVIAFSLEVSVNNGSVSNLIVKDDLPDKLSYRSDSLKINGISSAGDITTGINLGEMSAGEKKTISFVADLAGSDQFSFGENKIVNSAKVTGDNISASDSAEIIVTKKAVAGAATEISTGLTNNVFLDSFLLPLLAAFLILWLLKSRIVKFEEWLDKRKKDYQAYKSQKILRLKIKKIRLQELLNLKLNSFKKEKGSVVLILDFLFVAGGLALLIYGLLGNGDAIQAMIRSFFVK